MSVRFPWEAAYVEAILETDNDRLQQKIEQAEETLSNRMSTLSLPSDRDELQAVQDALHNLRALKKTRLS